MNKITQACIILASLTLSTYCLAHGGHGGYHGGGYHHGYYGGYHGHRHGYYGRGYGGGYYNRGYYNSGYYGGYPYWGPAVVVGGAYYAHCHYVTRCNRYHHCWRKRIC